MTEPGLTGGTADPGGLDPGGLDPGGLDPGGLDPGGLDPGGPGDLADDGEWHDPDADLLAPPPRRTDRWTLVLTGALIAALGFGAGAIVQRETGDDVGAVAGSRSARGAGGGQFGQFGQFRQPGQFGEPGQFREPGQSGGFAGGGSGSGGSGSGGSGSGGSAAGNASGGAVPAVIGTVVRVEGNTLVVRNLAGDEVTVTVPDGTKVTTATTVELGALAPGTTVTVAGTKGSGGGVTASAVTARPKEAKK